MKTMFLPLVNWGMGTIMIGVFAVVCVVLVAVIYNLTRSTQKVNDDNNKVSKDDTIKNI